MPAEKHTALSYQQARAVWVTSVAGQLSRLVSKRSYRGQFHDMKTKLGAKRCAFPAQVSS